jgi:Na+/H+ antiporter NhaB
LRSKRTRMRPRASGPQEGYAGAKCSLSKFSGTALQGIVGGFFAIVSVTHSQHLFDALINFVVSLQGRKQLTACYLASGLLSSISDKVFVTAIYINETAKAFAEGRISRESFNLLAAAINTGTNIPGVATPNGQAAFLFLLTSGIAPLARLSYVGWSGRRSRILSP